MVEKISSVSLMGKSMSTQKTVSPMKKSVVPVQKSVSPMVVGEKKSKLWLWILIAVIVVAVVGVISWLLI